MSRVEGWDGMGWGCRADGPRCGSGGSRQARGSAGGRGAYDGSGTAHSCALAAAAHPQGGASADTSSYTYPTSPSSPSTRPAPSATGGAPVIEVVCELGHRVWVQGVLLHALPPDDGGEQAVNHLVGVPPDGRGEVGVDGAGQPVMGVLGWRQRARREVARLVHAAGGHDARQLVEVRVGGLGAGVERLAEGVRAGVVEREAVLRQRPVERVERARSGRRMPAQHGAMREGAGDGRSNRAVCEQHELLHHRVGLLVFVDADVGRVR